MEQSRGRRYPERRHPYRDDFQRDRDRVIHARAFRRLEAKTQVFTPGLSDHFRNRLHGQSKLSLREQVNYLRHLVRLYRFRLTQPGHRPTQARRAA